MNVIIVAAGPGRRLMPLTKDLPKCLIEVNGRKIVDFTLEVLRELDLNEIIMVVGHQQKKIKDYLGRRVKYVTNPMYSKTNSMYSLWCAQDYFNGEFLYLHSDIIFEKSILEQVLSCNHEICLCVDEKEVDEEDMKVKIDKGKIIKVNKLILPEEATGEFIGIAKFMKNGITSLKQILNDLVVKDNNHNEYFEYAIEHLIKRNYDIFPSLTKNMYYAEIDCLTDVHRVNAELRQRKDF